MALGFGIIGCGMIAGFHSKAINDTRGAKLVACFDKRACGGRSPGRIDRCSGVSRFESNASRSRC